MPMATQEAQREYQRQWIARRRAEYFADKVCAKCGSTEELELDHINPADKISNSIWSWSAVRREQELAKCQVLCHPHHVEKTIANNDIQPKAQHGSGGMYANGCRCDPCTDYHALTWQNWKHNRK